MGRHDDVVATILAHPAGQEALEKLARVASRSDPWERFRVVPLPSRDGWPTVMSLTRQAIAERHRRVLMERRAKGLPSVGVPWRLAIMPAGMPRRAVTNGAMLLIIPDDVDISVPDGPWGGTPEREAVPQESMEAMLAGLPSREEAVVGRWDKQTIPGSPRGIALRPIAGKLEPVAVSVQHMRVLRAVASLPGSSPPKVAGPQRPVVVWGEAGPLCVVAPLRREVPAPEEEK